MLAGNRSQAVERLRAAASMLERASLRSDSDTEEVLEVVAVAVLLITDGKRGDREAAPGEHILFATADAVEKFNDCRDPD